MLLRNVEGWSCSSFVKKCKVGHVNVAVRNVGHVVVLLLRNAAGRFCSSFVVKKC